jgi:hypothetical protein
MLNVINTGLWVIGIWFTAWMVGGALWIVWMASWSPSPAVRSEVDHNLR